jgi:hypothetical protein
MFNKLLFQILPVSRARASVAHCMRCGRLRARVINYQLAEIERNDLECEAKQ